MSITAPSSGSTRGEGKTAKAALERMIADLEGDFKKTTEAIERERKSDWWWQRWSRWLFSGDIRSKEARLESSEERLRELVSLHTKLAEAKAERDEKGVLAMSNEQLFVWALQEDVVDLKHWDKFKAAGIKGSMFKPGEWSKKEMFNDLVLKDRGVGMKAPVARFLLKAIANISPPKDSGGSGGSHGEGKEEGITVNNNDNDIPDDVNNFRAVAQRVANGGDGYTALHECIEWVHEELDPSKRRFVVIDAPSGSGKTVAGLGAPMPDGYMRVYLPLALSQPVYTHFRHLHKCFQAAIADDRRNRLFLGDATGANHDVKDVWGAHDVLEGTGSSRLCGLLRALFRELWGAYNEAGNDSREKDAAVMRRLLNFRIEGTERCTLKDLAGKVKEGPTKLVWFIDEAQHTSTGNLTINMVILRNVLRALNVVVVLMGTNARISNMISNPMRGVGSRRGAKVPWSRVITRLPGWVGPVCIPFNGGVRCQRLFTATANPLLLSLAVEAANCEDIKICQSFPKFFQKVLEYIRRRVADRKLVHCAEEHSKAFYTSQLSLIHNPGLAADAQALYGHFALIDPDPTAALTHRNAVVEFVRDERVIRKWKQVGKDNVRGNGVATLPIRMPSFYEDPLMQMALVGVHRTMEGKDSMHTVTTAELVNKVHAMENFQNPAERITSGNKQELLFFCALRVASCDAGASGVYQTAAELLTGLLCELRTSDIRGKLTMDDRTLLDAVKDCRFPRYMVAWDRQEGKHGASQTKKVNKDQLCYWSSVHRKECDFALPCKIDGILCGMLHRTKNMQMIDARGDVFCRVGGREEWKKGALCCEAKDWKSNFTMDDLRHVAERMANHPVRLGLVLVNTIGSTVKLGKKFPPGFTVLKVAVEVDGDFKLKLIGKSEGKGHKLKGNAVLVVIQRAGAKIVPKVSGQKRGRARCCLCTKGPCTSCKCALEKKKACSNCVSKNCTNRKQSRSSKSRKSRNVKRRKTGESSP